MEKSEKIEIYDTTLRDGTQQSGINLSLEEKNSYHKKLMNLELILSKVVLLDQILRMKNILRE